MIEELWIRNLGVIGDATLPLGPGFTVVSGETGAGKTMVVTALGLLLGERADTGAIRSGSGQAVAEGRWLVPTAGPVADRVQDAGGEIDPVDDSSGELILSRSISPEGRSRATVGGRSVPVGALGEIGQQLVVVHGQSEQLRLRSTTAQREALDRFGGAEVAEALAGYRDLHGEWVQTAAELESLVGEHESRAREAEELRAAIDEIEQLAPLRGEDDDLRGRIDRLSSIEELRVAASEAHEAISAEDTERGADALVLVDGARRTVERLIPKDQELAPIAQSLTEASYLLSDLSGQLAGYLAGLDADGVTQLPVLQERLAALTTASRRYGSLDEAIDFLDAGSARLMELDNDSSRIELLAATQAELLERLTAQADRLSALRRGAATALADGVTSELTALAMPQASLQVTVEPLDEFGASGRDQVAILLEPHAGAEARPIGRGASGGELSRVMLAIEVVIAGTDPVPTFVFDEVDAGVGGAAAIEIGRRLARLAETAQVIVVTHLAQVAAFAGNHLQVAKGSDGSVTSSTVRQLTGDERVSEMARLLSGLPDSESGLAHARELLELATR